jgi:hypothetical protein
VSAALIFNRTDRLTAYVKETGRRRSSPKIAGTTVKPFSLPPACSDSVMLSLPQQSFPWGPSPIVMCSRSDSNPQ